MKTVEKTVKVSVNEVTNAYNEMDMRQEVIYNTVKAHINGGVENIILGYSIYNMERPKDKLGLISLLDKEKVLDVIFHLADADIFWKEGI